MSDSEYTITLNVRQPGSRFDPGFHLTLQCSVCTHAWFKRVKGGIYGLPVQCVNCGHITIVEDLFDILATEQTDFPEKL